MHILTRINHLLLLLGIGFGLGTAHAQLLPPPAPGEYQIKGEFSYFTTSGNYESDGVSTELENGSKLSTMMGSGEFIVDMTRNIRLQAGFMGGQTGVDRYDKIEDETSYHTNMGVSDVWVRGQYWLNKWGFDVVPDAAFYYPLFRVDTTSGDPLVGEGAMRLRAGGWLIYAFGSFFPYGYLGYEYRDDGRSAQLPYELGVQWAPGNEWWAQLGVRGYSAMSSDSNNTREREEYLFNVQGGSDRFYSVNGSSTEAVIMAGTHFGQLGIYIGAGTTVIGHNSAHGSTAFAGITFDGTVFAPTPSAYDYDSYIPPKSNSAQEKFRAKSEKYDPSMFTESTTPRSQEQSIDEDRIANRARRSRPHLRPRPKLRPAPPMNETLPTVDLIMKDTQKSLEKRKPEQ
jgi:hypothetical protein